MPRIAGTFIPVATTAANSTGTIALADQLIHLRERVPLSAADIAAATGADEETVAVWLARQAAPSGAPAARLTELIAAVERLEVTTKREAIADRLRRAVPALDGRTPLETIAAGGYERIAGFAEDLITPPFS
jgi:DNA-binding transcriptional regulator YiaG